MKYDMLHAKRTNRYAKEGVPILLTIVLLLAAVAGGAAGVILRAFELSFAYSDGLAVTGHPLTVLLIGVSVAVGFLLYMIIRAITRRETEVYNMVPAWGIRLLAGLALLFAGGWDLYRAVSVPPASLSSLLFAVLTVLTAAAVIYPSVLGLAQRECGPFNLVFVIPVFWGCFRLITIFFDHSSNPVVAGFMYDLFGGMALLMTLYYTAGLYFGRRHVARMRLMGGLTFYFGLVTLMGPLVFRWLGNDAGSLPHMHFLRINNEQQATAETAVMIFMILFGLSALMMNEYIGHDEDYEYEQTEDKDKP
jgi:hypothetical protein